MVTITQYLYVENCTQRVVVSTSRGAQGPKNKLPDYSADMGHCGRHKHLWKQNLSSFGQTQLIIIFPSKISSWCVNDDDIAGAAAAAAINCHSLANISHITMDNNNEIFDGEMIMNWVSAGAPCIVDLQ